MPGPWTVGLAAIDRICAEQDPVRYTGGGLDNAVVQAIRSEIAGEPFQGPGATVRHVIYEVRKVDLPDMPARGDRIDHAGDVWSVIDVKPRDDIARWELSVERAAE